MRRSRTLAFLLLFPLISAVAFSAPTTERKGSGPSTVAGVYSITFNLNIASTLPAGTTIVCKAQIAPNLPGLQSGVVPVETAAGVATVTGSTATCLVEIPFSWTLNNAKSGAVLSYEIDAVNASGALPVLLRTSALAGTAEPFPAAGATSDLSFSVTF
jgi:hypothetical protein